MDSREDDLSSTFKYLTPPLTSLALRRFLVIWAGIPGFSAISGCPLLRRSNAITASDPRSRSPPKCDHPDRIRTPLDFCTAPRATEPTFCLQSMQFSSKDTMIMDPFAKDPTKKHGTCPFEKSAIRQPTATAQADKLAGSRKPRARQSQKANTVAERKEQYIKKRANKDGSISYCAQIRRRTAEGQVNATHTCKTDPAPLIRRTWSPPAQTAAVSYNSSRTKPGHVDEERR